MVFIEPFAVERWMDEHETWAKWNLSETASAPISLNDLLSLSSPDNTNEQSINTLIDPKLKLGYGSIPGSARLRRNIAENLYDASVEPDNVLITPGAIAANFLVLLSMVKAGDHVICQYPTYQQLFSIPKSLGAEVSYWRSREEDNWRLEIEDLKKLIKKNTKLIIINSPQNPTCQVVPLKTLQAMIKIASSHKPDPIYLFADEVYRPLFHSLASASPTSTKSSSSSSSMTPSLITLSYPYSIVTGSMSKSFSLPGIRVGWIASPSSKLMSLFDSNRDYTNISVSQVDDQIASFALSTPTINNILHRNATLAVSNLKLVSETLSSFGEGITHWIPPTAGTTMFVRFTSCRVNEHGKPIDDVAFCQRLQEQKSVMFVPGKKCFGNDKDFAGYVRVGYNCDRDVLEEGLKRLREFMEDKDPKGKGFGGLPLAEIVGIEDEDERKDTDENENESEIDSVEFEKEVAHLEALKLSSKKQKRFSGLFRGCFTGSS